MRQRPFEPCFARVAARLAALTALAMTAGACSGAPTRPRFETVPMLDMYAGEEHGGGHYKSKVTYLSEEARETFRLYVKDGLLTDREGRKLDPDLDPAQNPEKNGFLIYVMTADGDIYWSFGQKKGEFHHSSLLAGAPVACAGDMSVIDGELLEISNSSGHYRPPPPMLDQVVQRLAEMGVDVSGVKLTRVGDD